MRSESIDNNDIILTINEDSPKIEPNKITNAFINIPIKPIKPINPKEPSADLVHIKYEDSNSSDNNNINDGIIKYDYNTQADKLLEVINESKRKLANSLYITSCKYDTIYYRYNSISLAILVISTIITFIEAIRLTIVNYNNEYKGSTISNYISIETISLLINCLSLSLSTILTVLSSIARFKNYKENMDKLKNIHDDLFNYKNLYDREKELIKFFKISGCLDNNLYEKIKDNIEEYNKAIKDISTFENIRNKDILKFNKIKAEHDIKLHKITNDKEIELLKITMNSNRKKEEINSNINTSYRCCNLI